MGSLTTCSLGASNGYGGVAVMQERRVQQSCSRVGRVMARPLEMKSNKRKEVEGENEEGRMSWVSEKRPKLEPLPGEEDQSGGGGGGGVMVAVRRILEARRRKSTRPLPAKIGDKEVDLVALHSRVHALGGYSKVTEAGLWSSVAESLGFGPQCGLGLKLVFVKYLKALETDQLSKEVTTRLDASSSELAIHSRHEHTGVPQGDDSKRYSGAGALLLSDEDVIGDLHQRNQGDCRLSSVSEDWVTTTSGLDGNPRFRQGEAGASDQGPGVSEGWFEGRREENVHQQREALRGMLDWIKRVAVCPVPACPDDDEDHDSAAAEGSSGQDDWASQCLMLTAKVRSVMWKKPGRGGDNLNQRKQTPSLHYDDTVRPDAQTLGRLRATRERLESYGFQPSPGAMSQHQEIWGSAGVPYSRQRPGRQGANNFNDSAFTRYSQQRKRIPMGPEFQADIPEWIPRDRSGDTLHENSTGEGPSGSHDEEDDERRMGVTVWSQAEAADRLGRPAGTRRPMYCDCEEQGSINCVRVHIATSRALLRSELGPAAFAQMGFEEMGECVAERHWSRDDERTFRLVARSHPASKGNNFWDYLPSALPHKTRMELNSYYFNVFMLRRRALQNRLNDCKIDSDDDETELPGESDESEYDSSSDDDDDEDDDDDDDEDEIFSDGADGVPDLFPLKIPDVGMLKYRPLPVFSYSPAEVAMSRAQMGVRLDEVDAGNHIAPEHADSSHVVLMWDDKHLDETGSDRPWEEHPDWGGRDEPEVCPEAAPPTRQLSPPKEDVRQGAAAAALGDLWSHSMEMAPKLEKDKLLSTNGMILELFGDDVRY